MVHLMREVNIMPTKNPRINVVLEPELYRSVLPVGEKNYLPELKKPPLRKELPSKINGS